MVSFGDALKICLKTKVFNFSDRASRSEFWWFILGGWLINLVCAIIQIIPLIGTIIGLIGMLWVFIASMSVSFRRLHDLNHSGLWLVFPYICMVLGLFIVLVAMASGSEALVLSAWILLSLSVISILVLWIMMIFPGTVGDNRFGPDPIA